MPIVVIAVLLGVMTLVGFLVSGGVGVLVIVVSVMVAEWSTFAVGLLLNMLHHLVQRHQVVVVESMAVFVVMVSQ